jgi:hypothetical protein
MAKKYTDFFQLVRSLAGVDAFTSDEENDILRLANRRFYEAYSASQMWTPYLVVGDKRAIWYEGRPDVLDYFTPTQNVNFTNALQGAPKQLVPFEENNKIPIKEFQRIHRDQPFVNTGTMEYNYYVDGFGAHVMNLGNTNDDFVYVTYKKPFTDFTKNSQDIPDEFFYYGAHATYADFLRMDGQTSKAMDEENKAATYLATELEKLDIISNNNVIRRKFTTYVSTQSR